MMSKMLVKVLKATRDQAGHDTAHREALFNIICNIFKNHKAKEIGTTVLELKHTYIDR
jgi:histidyl-tRNA synthetase